MEKPIGIVRCLAESLVPYDQKRHLNPRQVEKLAKLFRTTECRPTEKRNHIRGIVTYAEVRHILAKLKLSRKDLRATIRSGTYPFLDDQRIVYLDGRHRLAAAAQCPGGSKSWWVVALYCVDGEWAEFSPRIDRPRHISAKVQREVEHFSHEANYRDGEIFTIIWQSRLENDEAREKQGWQRLTGPRAINLRGFLKYPELAQALYDLSRFPGVIWGLQLGNVHRHVADHIDELILAYFEHILKVWSFITGENPDVMAEVDPKSVLDLQRRAPGVTEHDRQAIRRMFREGAVFPAITNPDQRHSLEENILSLNLMIPSLETFHENMKYISVGAKILRRYLVEVPRSGENKKDRQPCRKNTGKATLLESLAADWTAPDTAYVESAHNEFSPLADGTRPTARFSFQLVFLIALRNFRHLYNVNPRQGTRHQGTQHQDIRDENIMRALAVRKWVTYLLQVAVFLGFDNQKIRDGLAQCPGAGSAPDFEPKTEHVAHWSGGTPFAMTVGTLESDGFLPRLAQQQQPPGDRLSPAFVLDNILKAFFGITSVAVDPARPVISTDKEVKKAVAREDVPSRTRQEPHRVQKSKKKKPHTSLMKAKQLLQKPHAVNEEASSSVNASHTALLEYPEDIVMENADPGLNDVTESLYWQEQGEIVEENEVMGNTTPAENVEEGVSTIENVVMENVEITENDGVENVPTTEHSGLENAEVPENAAIENVTMENVPAEEPTETLIRRLGRPPQETLAPVSPMPSAIQGQELQVVPESALQDTSLSNASGELTAAAASGSSHQPEPQPNDRPSDVQAREALENAPTMPSRNGRPAQDSVAIRPIRSMLTQKRNQRTEDSTLR